MELVYLDTETTGLSEDARLIQIAWLVEPITDDIHVQYCRPPVPISFEAMAINHITEEMVANSLEFSKSIHKLYLNNKLESGEGVLVAHNAKFDIRILKNEGVIVPKYICTKQVAQHLIGSDSYSLQYLRYSLGLKVVAGNAHDAKADVQVLKALFDHLYNLLKTEKGLENHSEIIEEMQKLTLKNVLLRAPVKFGKHKGRTFAQIKFCDRGYLEWLLKEETKKPEFEQNSDLVFTLGYYLDDFNS